MKKRKRDDDLRVALARELCAITDGWTQAAAAAFLGLDQPDLSRLRRGHVARFSVERLLRLLMKRHYDIEIHLKPIARPFAVPRQLPAATVIRFERSGRPVTDGRGADAE